MQEHAGWVLCSCLDPQLEQILLLGLAWGTALLVKACVQELLAAGHLLVTHGFTWVEGNSKSARCTESTTLGSLLIDCYHMPALANDSCTSKAPTISKGERLRNCFLHRNKQGAQQWHALQGKACMHRDTPERARATASPERPLWCQPGSSSRSPGGLRGSSDARQLLPWEAGRQLPRAAPCLPAGTRKVPAGTL
jgi:hypothetical protein